MVSGARARSFLVFHVDIRLYAIGQTDVCRHEKVMEVTTMWGSLRLAPIKMVHTVVFGLIALTMQSGSVK